MYQHQTVVAAQMATGRFRLPQAQTAKEPSEVIPVVAVYTVSSAVSIQN